MAKGIGNGVQDLPGGGWVLMQMHDSWCFHYEGWNGTNPASTTMNMVFTSTFFASQNPNAPPNPVDVSPLNPSYVVVCAGRDGDTLRIAVNGVDDDSTFSAALAAGTRLDAGSSHPLTLGGYDTNTFLTPGYAGTNHVFRGRIYETAVWKLPATPGNLQAKLAAVQGLPTGALYRRNREAAFVGPDGQYHTAGRNSPRIDATKGFLFGLQSWNRLSSWTAVAPGLIPAVAVYAPGEDFSLWTPNAAGGASPSVVKDTAVPPPGDARTYSYRITLPAGTSLSLPLGAFDAVGPIHGQIFLRAGTAGTLRIRTTDPAPAGSDRFDVDLATISQASWERVWLHRGSGVGDQLTTGLGAGAMVFLENPGSADITFQAWGFDLTQLAAGGDLGSFDPGIAMYDWSAFNDPTGDPPNTRAPLALDVLELPNLTSSTASTGFCLSADAQPADGLAWTAAVNEQRNAVAWKSGTQDLTARVFVDGGGNAGQLCMTLASSTDPSPPVACGDLAPLNWAAGSLHTVAGCLSAAGQMRVYADGVQLGTATTVPAASVPSLAGGHLLVGNSGSRPWHGFVRKALACVDTGNPSSCH